MLFINKINVLTYTLCKQKHIVSIIIIFDFRKTILISLISRSKGTNIADNQHIDCTTFVWKP